MQPFCVGAFLFNYESSIKIQTHPTQRGQKQIIMAYRLLQPMHHPELGGLIFVEDTETKQSFPVTNPLSDLLRLQRASEINRMAKENNPYDNEAKAEPFFHAGLCTGAILWGDRSPFTAEDMVGFAEFRGTYIKMHGGWMHRYANQHDLSNLITTEKLLEIYLTETAFSRVKESEVEIEMIEVNKFTAPSFGYLQTELVWQPRLTDGKVTVTKIL